MEQAKRMLEKYGWSEGAGLGKNLDGIKEPLKATKKLDKAGIGHNLSSTFTNRWWEDSFNNAASNIKIQTTEDGVKMEAINNDSSKNVHAMRISDMPHNFQLCGFLQRETLKNGKIVSGDRYEEPLTRTSLTDEELFQACGGRTVHKAARHGLTLSGKLRRVQEQEQAVLQRCINEVAMPTAASENNILSKTCDTASQKITDSTVISTSNEIATKTCDELYRRKNGKRRKAEESNIVGHSEIKIRKRVQNQDSMEHYQENDTVVGSTVETHSKKKKKKRDKL